MRKKSLKDKQLDMVCLNIIDQKNYFGSDQNELYFITLNNENKKHFAKQRKIGI